MAIKNKIELSELANIKQQLVDIAYKTGEELKKAQAKFLANNANWKVLKESHTHAGSKDSQYKAVAFVNETTKEVVIANAGTQPSPFDIKQAGNDVLADFQLAARLAPELKLASIKSFNTEVSKNLPNGGADYNFSFTGHSLGSVCAELGAVDAYSRGLNVTECTTFDNPGSAPLIEGALERGLFTNNNMTMDDLRSDIKFTSIQAQNPNVISRCNPQMGEVYIKVQNIKTAVNASGAQIVPAEDGSANYVSYLFSKVGTAAVEAAPALNLKNACTVYKAYRDFYNPKKFAETTKAFETVKGGLLERLEDLSKPFENIKDDFEGVKGNLFLIGTGIVSMAAGNYIGGVSLALGGFGLVCSTYSLYHDTKEAYNKIVTVANSFATAGGHSLVNFKDITENNLLKVQSGGENYGEQLVVHSNHTEEDVKKLHIIKTKAQEKAFKAVQTTNVVKNDSWSSWIYDKVTSPFINAKDAVVAHTEDLTNVKVVIGNETVTLTPEQLSEFCAKRTSTDAEVGKFFIDTASNETDDVQITGEAYFGVPDAAAAAAA